MAEGRRERRGNGQAVARQRWGVSEAALCGKGQGFSSLLSSRLVGGREKSEREDQRAAGTDVTHLIFQRGIPGEGPK